MKKCRMVKHAKGEWPIHMLSDENIIIPLNDVNTHSQKGNEKKNNTVKMTSIYINTSAGKSCWFDNFNQ